MLVTTSFDPTCRRLQAISLLFANNPNLLKFMFLPDRRGLSAPPSELLEFANGFSSGEKILVQVALDLWSGEGHAQMGDVVERLDLVRFEGFMLALECLRYGRVSI